ncbi:hypothetical protein O4O33_001200 [Escherichia coli]|nr:hypothetical protein [Escherichia coli]
MKSLFNRLTGKAVSRTAFVEHLGHEVVQHHPNWKVMISTDHKLMRIETPRRAIIDTPPSPVRFMVLCLGDATLNLLLISGTMG